MKSTTFFSKRFTLVEMMLAFVLLSLIVAGSVSALNFLASSREKINSHIHISQELRHIKNTLQKDLNNLYLALPSEELKFICTPIENQPDQQSLTFYCSNHSRVRPKANESDFYEVQYGLVEQDDKLKFVRRIWPVPDAEREMPGGVMMVLSENISDFKINFLDKEDEWVMEWDEEMRELPKLVQVHLSAKDQTKTNSSTLSSSFYVNVKPRQDFELGGGY